MTAAPVARDLRKGCRDWQWPRESADNRRLGEPVFIGGYMA
jgi:hypothetical protein